MTLLSSILTSKNIVAGGGGSGGGGGTFTGTGDPGLTRLEAIGTTFVNPPAAIRTIGYSRSTDIGGGLHVKVSVAPTNHTGYFTTADGSVYELQSEGGCVSLTQFGAQQMASFNVQPVAGSATDSYAAFLAADKYITAKGSGLTLIVPGGLWYISKTFNFNRASYIIDGNSMLQTFIRCPANMSGFVNAHNYGVGHDYTIPSTNTTYQTGQALFKLTGQVGAGNAYRVSVGGTTSATDDVLVDAANDPAATYTWGTAQFKFEANIGPTSAYDYNITYPASAQMQFKNFTIWSFWDNNSGDTNINKWPDQMATAGGEPAYYSGIILRCRGRVENVATLQFPGFGCVAVANGDPYLKGAGNVNGYHVDHLFAYYNGKAGWHVGYSDANAGYIGYIDTAFNGRCGVEEFSFLGNNYMSFQSANDGQYGAARKQYPSGCIYNGHGWLCRAPILGLDGGWPQDNPHISLNDEPGGAGSFGWIKYFNQDVSVRGTATGSVATTVLTVTATALTTIAVGDMLKGTGITAGTRISSLGSGTGGTGTYNLDHSMTAGSTTITIMNMAGTGGGDYWDWTPIQKFERGGSWLSNNRNARNLVLGFYIEGGCFPSQLGLVDCIIHGLTQTIDTSKGGLLENDGAWNNITTRGQYLYDSPVGLHGNQMTLGGFDQYGPRFFTHADNTTGSTMSLRYGKGDGTNGQSHQDIVFDELAIGVDGGPLATFLITSAASARTFGRSSAITNAFWPQKLIIPGVDSNQIDGRRLFLQDGHGFPPTSGGPYAVGDVCLAGAGAVSGGPSGYMCTNATGFGTWKSMGNLA